MKNKFCKWISHPFAKALLLSSLTLIIGGICSALGGWDYSKDPHFVIKFISLIFIFVVYVILLGYYSKDETNEKKIAKIYFKQNSAFEKEMSGLIGLCKRSAEGADGVIKSIMNEKKFDLKLWSFDKACIDVCKNVYDILCELGTGKDFEVVYVRLDESVKPEKEIYVNAYANKDTKRPSLYGRKRNIESDDYYDAELFRSKTSDFQVFVGSEEIDKHFGHLTKEKRNKNKHKYQQYIGIPVFCNDQKMVGLLEIVCLNKTRLQNTEEEIKEVVSKYFVAYSFFLLVLHKLEKALIASSQGNKIL